MAVPLTRRKEAWVKRRQPDIIRGKALNNPTILEGRYYEKLDNLVDRMCDEVIAEIKRFYAQPYAEEFVAQDASIASQARILTNAMVRKFTKMFADAAPDLAAQQIKSVDKFSSANMHASLSDLTGGLSLSTRSLSGPLTDIISASVTENVSLIKSIPQQYLTGVQGAVMRSITGQGGLQNLVPYLEKHKAITKRRARMIARDQTRKAYNNLNRGRMENIGLKKFEWLHTAGSNKPRKLHISYSGKVFSFDDLPIIDENSGQRGIPGDAINCRCRMIPVLEFDDE